jgi:hypothetical protein
MKTMVVEQRPEDIENKPAQLLKEPVDARAYALVMSLLVLVGIFAWTNVERASIRGSYASRPGEKRAVQMEPVKEGQQ